MTSSEQSEKEDKQITPHYEGLFLFSTKIRQKTMVNNGKYGEK